MSSPFQQKFSAKSPLNGNYYSGVDGLQYVSPKIPESKTPAEPSRKTKTPKTPEIPETKKTFDFGSNDIDPTITLPKSEFKFGGDPTDTAKIPETPAGVESVGITVPNELPKAEIPKTPADVITNRTVVNDRPTYRQAWDADLEGIKGKYKDYKSYVDDRTGQKIKDPEGYEKDLFTKTNLKTPGREEIDYQKINDEDETVTGRRFFTGKEYEI